MPVSKILRRRILRLELRRRTVNRPHRRGLHRLVDVDRFAENVEDASERAFADRNRDRSAGGGNRRAAHADRRSIPSPGSALGCCRVRPALRASSRAPASRYRRVRCQSARIALRRSCRVIFVHANRQRVVDLRQRFGRELDVDDVAEHLDDFTGGSHCISISFSVLSLHYSPVERFRAGDDFEQFFGDRGLAGVVHLNRELVDQLRRRCRSRCSSRRAERRRTPHRSRASPSRS